MASLTGRVYPCARCFKLVAGVIRQKDYDRDETPDKIGVKMRRRDIGGVREVVCAKCLREDYAERISPAKKILASAPPKSVISTALRNDGDEEDEDEEPVVVNIPKTTGLLTAGKTGKKKPAKSDPVQTSALPKKPLKRKKARNA